MKKLMILAIVVAFASSCSNDDPASAGNVTLKASAFSSTGKTSSSGRSEASSVVITDFKINISQIKFEIDEEDERHKSSDTYEDTKLNGPFLLDLLDPDKTLSQVITSESVPNGQYEEIKFKFEKSTAAGDLNGKTFLIKGTIDGKEFVVWSAEDAQLKMDFEDSSKDMVMSGDDMILNIKIKIDGLLTRMTELAKAGLLKDTDGDGIIEITTGDDDSHSSFGHELKDLVENESHLDDKD